MEFSVKSAHPEKQRTSCVVVGIFESRKLSPVAKQIDDVCEGYISSILRRGDLEGKLGQILLLHNVPNTLADRVLLVGCGHERDFGPKKFRKVVGKSMRILHETGTTETVCHLTELRVRGLNAAWTVRHAIEATRNALYSFEQLKSKAETAKRPLRKTIFTVDSRRELTAAEQACHEAQAIANGVELTKDLGNLPSNVCTPSFLAERAKKIARLYEKVSCEVLEESEMEKLGMNALLSVTKGSEEPAKLIILEYKGGNDDEPPVVLVGKGVTFDTGGISIKPSKTMDEMKYDMSGGGSVLGTLSAVAELNLPINVVGIVPAVENMPSGKATKPGDIVTSMSGQTIEILNTDAEGRLILCDALTYAARYNPDTVIDIATLTGACVVALGKHASGLWSNHSPLAHNLLNAGKQSCDFAWELPLWKEYQKQIESPFADIANVSEAGGAGAITAACFLSNFTKDYQWAHLDIAGTAWLEGKKKGATGRPVPLLTQYLIDRASEKEGVEPCATVRIK